MNAHPATALARAGEHEDDTLATRLMATARGASATLDRAISVHGSRTLGDYVQHGLPATGAARDRSGLGDAIRAYATPLLGARVADAAARQLARCPLALTTNHHGVDYFAQSVQGTLALSLARGDDAQPRPVVPVFACASVPLDNLTYPQGFLVYSADNTGPMATRVPIFSNSQRRRLVSAAPPMDPAMIARAERRIVAGQHASGFPAATVETLISLLREDYASDQVQGLGRYSDQAVALNSRVWRRMVAAGVHPPELVYLELEELTRRLLERDLADTDALATRVLFQPRLRARVLERLDGERGCWQRHLLAQRAGLATGAATAPAGGAGTVMFWGINDAGRRVPLLLTDDGRGQMRLVGRDDRGNEWRSEFSPAVVVDALAAGRLVPSVFTCFLEIAFARGVVCLGGYYQAEYLRSMQLGLAAALQDDDPDTAEALLAVPTEGYLGGMQAVVHRGPDGGLRPAGPIEIIAAGGLREDAIERVRALTVYRAHQASFAETIPELAPDAPLPTDWGQRFACEFTAHADELAVLERTGAGPG